MIDNDEFFISYRKDDQALQDRLFAMQTAKATKLWGLPAHETLFALGDKVRLRQFPGAKRHLDLRDMNGQGLPQGGTVSRVIGNVHAGHPQHIEVDGMRVSGYWYEKVKS